jgi:hypothetical protein
MSAAHSQYAAFVQNRSAVNGELPRRRDQKMTNQKVGAERQDPGATLSGALGREFELQLKKHPGDKQAQVDRGSDESMDASDPPSACQPGGNDPVPSNDFPELAEIRAQGHEAPGGRVVQTPSEEKS